MVTLGLTNSRLKDYYDIWRLSRAFRLEMPRVAAALNATFERRNTKIPSVEPEGLGQGYVERWAVQWKGLSNRYDLVGDLPPLQEVIQEIRELLMPVLEETSSFEYPNRRWITGEGWRD